jgi:hypothetical protein
MLNRVPSNRAYGIVVVASLAAAVVLVAATLSQAVGNIQTFV